MYGKHGQDLLRQRRGDPKPAGSVDELGMVNLKIKLRSVVELVRELDEVHECVLGVVLVQGGGIAENVELVGDVSDPVSQFRTTASIDSPKRGAQERGTDPLSPGHSRRAPLFVQSSTENGKEVHA
jgi:hypothetical protein